MDQQQKGLRQPLLDPDKTGAAKEQNGVVSMAAIRNARRQAKRDQMNMMVMPEEERDGAAFLSYNGKEVFVYDERACFCCGEKLRTRVVSLISHPIFDRFIISMIFANSIVMAVYEYKDRENKGAWNQKIEMLGRFFTMVFSIECFLKITAMGFIMHKNSYMRDSWNWLDFTVVCLGIAELTNILPAKDTKSIRILRVLRPLKSINSVPAMKRLVASLVASLNKLFDSVIIMTSCFLLFGILGVRQFKGLQYQRCRTTPEPVGKSWEVAPDIDRLCTIDGSGAFQCPSGYTCGRVLDYPDVPFSSEDVNNIALISFGYMSFDNIGVAMLTILQMITLEGWTDLMYQLGDAASTWMVIAFCILIVITGSFFILNLVLTVIVDSFDDDVEAEVRIEAEKKAKRTRELKVLYGYPLSDSEDSNDDDLVLQSPRSERAPSGDDEDVKLPERAQKNGLVFVFWYICQLEFFNLIMTVAIVINTYLLALDKYPMSKEYNQQLEKFNNFFSALFFGEMVIKMIGLGLTDYMSDNFNIFDSCIVSTSVVEFLIALSGIKTSGGALTSLRTLRLLRVFKLARSWTSFRELLEKIVMTLKDITNFSVLMLLFVFICSLLGMELYAYRIKFNDTSKAYPLVDPKYYDVGYYPRQNFNTLGSSFISVFGILIGENWNSCMYDHLRGKNNGATYVFFIFLFIFGNLILLNLFLGILLKNFEEPPGKDEEAEGVDMTAKERLINLFIVNYRVVVGEDPVREPLLLDDNRQEINRNKKESAVSLQVYQPPVTREVDKIFTISRAKKLQKQKQKKGACKKIHLYGKSLCVFSRVNTLRVWCKNLVGHPHFDTFILGMIGMSSIMLTFEGPNTDPNGATAKFLKILDPVVTLIFLCELLAKVVVYGLIANGPDSYLKSPWNILDFIIVCISIMLAAFQGQNLKNMKILRILRVLRPLRMIAKNPGMSIVVMSMLNGFKDIGNVMVVSVLFVGMFAILGTNLFKGSFYYCLTDNVRSGVDIVDKIDCMDYGGEWVNRDQNFDNVGTAAVTLFNVMTTEGWLGVMWHSVDAVGIDFNPQMNKNNIAEFFYVFFMVMGSLFILNMFVGVVINVFNQEKEKLERNYLLTEIQKEWCDILIKMYKTELLVVHQESGDVLKDLCYKIVTHGLFDNAIMTCIIFNTFCMALTWYDQNPDIPKYLWYVNTFFNIVYTIEAALKLTAFGTVYFDAGWNVFDFTIVVATWSEEIIKLFIEVNLNSSTAVIRTFRVGRIFKLLKKNKNLRVLFKTLIDAIPQLTNVGGIMLLILFIYSILGVALFGKVMLQENLNVHANFQTFGTALLTLFRMATGESWNMIMYDCGRPASITFNCKPTQDYDDIVKNGIQGCGKPGLAKMYFISYMLVVALIFINLFIVIIFESFQESQIEEALKVGGKTIDLFCLLWQKYDPRGTGFIARGDMQALIIDIIDEELQQLAQLKKDIYDGLIDREEFKTKIQMFGLHKEESLVDVTSIKEEAREVPEHEKDPHVLAQQMRDKRLVAKACMQFVHQMRLPFYGTQLDRFYFYDVLEGLSRNLFQNLVIDARREMMQQQPGLQGIDGDVSFRSLSNVQPARDDDCVDEAEIEEEHRCDILRGAFDVILYKIEQKGRKHKIMKFDKMHGMRQERNSREILKQLSAFGEVIFDSSYIKASAVIAKHLKRWLKKREIMKKLQQNLLSRMQRPGLQKGRIDLKMERVKSGADQKIVRGLNYRSLVGAQQQTIQDMELLKKRAGKNYMHNRYNSFINMDEASRLEQEEDLDRDKVDQKSIDQFQKILAIQKLQLKNLQITRQISEIQSECHSSFRDSNMSMSMHERTGRSYMEQFIRTRSNMFMKYIMIHLMEQLTYVDKFEEKGGHQTAKFGEFMTYYNQSKNSPMPLFPGIQIFKIAMCSKTIMRQIMDRIKPLTFRDLRKYHELSNFAKLLMKKPDLSKYSKMNHEIVLKYYKAWSYEHSVLRPVTPSDNGPKLANPCLDIIWSQNSKHGGFYRLRNVRLGNGKTHFMDIDILLDPRINSSARHAFDTTSKLYFEKICHLLTGFARVYKFQIENKKSLKLDSMTEGFLFKGHLKEYGRQIEILKDLSISIKVGYWEQKEFTSDRCVLYKMAVPYGKWSWTIRNAEGTSSEYNCPLALYHAFQDPTKQNQIFVQKEPCVIKSLKTNQPPKKVDPNDMFTHNDESTICVRFY